MDNEGRFYARVLQCKEDYQSRFGKSIELFVETGTATGQTSLWAADHFDKVITVELMDDLYISAIHNLWDRWNVRVLSGNSSEWTIRVFDDIQEEAIWFLDAHNVNRSDGLVPPEETPVMKEIEKITYSRSEVIIIDDLRLFGSEPGYPSVGDIRDLMEARQYEFSIYPDEDLMIAFGTVKPKEASA